jgi:hypothetical protein
MRYISRSRENGTIDFYEWSEDRKEALPRYYRAGE